MYVADGQLPTPVVEHGGAPVDADAPTRVYPAQSDLEFSEQPTTVFARSITKVAGTAAALASWVAGKKEEPALRAGERRGGTAATDREAALRSQGCVSPLAAGQVAAEASERARARGSAGGSSRESIEAMVEAARARASAGAGSSRDRVDADVSFEPRIATEVMQPHERAAQRVAPRVARIATELIDPAELEIARHGVLPEAAEARDSPSEPGPRCAVVYDSLPGEPPPLEGVQPVEAFPYDSPDAYAARIAAETRAHQRRRRKAARVLPPTAAAPAPLPSRRAQIHDPQARADYPEVLRALNLAPNDLRRNQVPYTECTLAGGAIDVATGKVILTQLDFQIGGACPIAFHRVWFSSSDYRGPLGRGWHHAFDLALARGSDCVAVRLADGRVVWFPEPDVGGSHHCANERLSLSRDHYGYVLRAADGCKHRFVSHRARGAYVLGTRTARDGHELRFGYDDRARLVRITAAAERTLELEYETHDRLFRISAPHPLRAGERIVLVQYAYDEDGHLRKAADALGQAERYRFELGALVTRANRNGSGAHFGWDARDRCSHAWIDGGVCDRKLTYLDGETHVLDSLRHTRVYHHDGALVERTIDASGAVRRRVRGAGRRIECEQDELGHCVRKRYDARGNLIELCLADGASWRFAYDSRDRLLHAVDALGGSWRFEYGAGGRLLSATDPLGNARRYAYRGRWLVAIFEPDGRQTRFSYDPAGNLAVRVACDGTVTKYEHDDWGQLIALADVAGNGQEREYDLLGRLVRVRGPEGTCELSYDAESNLTSWRDSQCSVRWTYQGSARISSRKSDGATLCFEYDSEEQLVAIVNEHGRVYRIARDARGDVRELGDFDGNTHSFTRDAAGRLVRCECAGEFSEYEYDAVGRVIEVVRSDGSFEGYRYRPDGALESAWNQHIGVELERDAIGRILVERQGQHAIESQYDSAGRRTGIQSSFGMRALLEYSATGALRTLSERTSGFELRFERDALALELERLLPGGVRCTWARDGFGQPTAQRIEGPGGEVLRELEYAWGPGGRLQRCTDSACGTLEYHFDPQGRLAWAETQDGSFRLRMPDAVGNVFARDDRRDREYGASGQVLTRSSDDGEVRCSYDVHGRLRERREPGGREWHFQWNAAGILTGVTRPDGTRVTFAYDPFGRRIWKKTASHTTHWLWDGPQLLHEWIGEDASAALTWLREPENGAPLAQLAGERQLSIVGDCQAAPLCVLARSVPLWAAVPDIYGDLALVVGAREGFALRPGGMYEDAETGLYCAGARYYDPRSGTYLAPDRAPPGLRAYALDADLTPCAFAPAVFSAHAACELTLRNAAVSCGLPGRDELAEHRLLEAPNAWIALRPLLPAARTGPPSALDRSGRRQVPAAGTGPAQRPPAVGPQLAHTQPHATGAPNHGALTAYAAAHGIPPVEPPRVVWLATPDCVLAP